MAYPPRQPRQPDCPSAIRAGRARQQTADTLLKPKGSTESLLRPKETDDPLPENESENVNGVENNLPDSPTLTGDTAFPSPATPARAPVPTVSNGTPPRILHHSSPPGLVPLQTTLTSVLRKRKTGSIASGKSQAPKYRTRSMIIVHYDSAVQNAFEELVKLISASRNMMRKGKMAARMADMKKMAELVTDAENEDKVLPVAQDAANSDEHAVASAPVKSVSKGLEADNEEEKVTKLEFASTRKMGPSRDSLAADAFRKAGNGYITGMGQRAFSQGCRGIGGLVTPESFSSIFDKLDSGLGCCQSMCEHAAHQFLRDGNCSTEIAGIKRRLWKVKEIAERETAKAAAEKKEEPMEEPMAENVGG